MIRKEMEDGRGECQDESLTSNRTETVSSLAQSPLLTLGPEPWQEAVRWWHARVLLFVVFNDRCNYLLSQP